MGFSRQEYWSGLPFPSPGDLLDSGIEPGSPPLQADALPSKPPGQTLNISIYYYIYYCIYYYKLILLVAFVSLALFSVSINYLEKRSSLWIKSYFHVKVNQIRRTRKHSSDYKTE